MVNHKLHMVDKKYNLEVSRVMGKIDPIQQIDTLEKPARSDLLTFILTSAPGNDTAGQAEQDAIATSIALTQSLARTSGT